MKTPVLPLIGLVAVSLTAMATCSKGAEMAHSGDLIVISGSIEENDDAKFSNALPIGQNGAPKGITVILNSSGGRVKEATMIAYIIHARGYATRIRNGDKCSSACTIMWLAGKDRSCAATAQFGIHRSMIQGHPEYANDPGNERMARTMTGYGAPPAMIDIMLKTPATKIEWLSCEQLKAWGLLKGLTS